MRELIDRLKAAWTMCSDDGDEYGLCDTLLEAAAALEAAREDACVALVADIRFACGDNGKRMQPELVEFIRELAQDAERLDWLAEGFRTCTVYMGGNHPWTPGHKVRSLHGPSFRAAIDQARGKAGPEAGLGGGE